jgi:HEAT repeat protein
MSTILDSLFESVFGGQPDIERMKLSRDVEGLRICLSPRNNITVRRKAAFALGLMRDPWALRSLIKCLKDKDVEVRRGAAWSLGIIGDTRAVEPLLEALKNTDCDVRVFAVEALGRIGDSRAIEPLTTALKDERDPVRSSVEEALGRLEQMQRAPDKAVGKKNRAEAQATLGAHKKENKDSPPKESAYQSEDKVLAQC